MPILIDLEKYIKKCLSIEPPIKKSGSTLKAVKFY